MIEPIIRAAQQGDSDAFGQLYTQHSPLVYKVCRGILRNHDDAKDCVQVVFMRLLKTLASFNGDAAFTTWLYRVALNEALGYLRSSAKLRYAFGDGDVSSFTKYSSPLEDRTAYMTLEKIMLHAPTGYRKVLQLYVLGYECQEIARELGCSTGNVKSQLSRARQYLRKTLFPGKN